MHIVEASHSFVDVPHRAATTAQRVRIGLTGLAFAFLLVLLGSIVSRSGRDENSVATANEVANTPKEPLAELGVAPGPGTTDTAQNSETGSR
ncbi:MAG: hypothetical protein ACTHN4_11200 [Sphingomicrobium sp.]